MTGPAYLRDIEIAELLGRSKNWFCKERPRLEREGFPRVDGLIGLTCRADVEAWIARRRQVPDADVARTTISSDYHVTLIRSNDYGNL